MNQEEKVSKGTVLSAMFLVGGTCIGGGMLALPVATGINGFIPSLAMMLLCWFTMTATALLLLEVSLWMEKGAHVITMTSRLLGTPGKIISWCIFLFISYASIVAYTAGAGIQVASAFNHHFDLSMTKEVGAVLFAVTFCAVIYLGSRVVGRVNSILFIAMIVAYLGLIGTGLDEIKSHLLLNQKWTGAYLAVPLLLTSFSFQTMVPSLPPYLKMHPGSLRVAVIGGTLIALLIYGIWQFLILGIVPPEGSNGLAAALARGEPATQFLVEHVEGLWIGPIAEYFAFFAIVTSFLGMTLGLFDFLSDGLKIKKTGLGRVILGILVLVPTLFFATQYERVFLVALDTSGGFGDTILNGLIPVLMVWVGRYRMGYQDHFRVPGGKPFLVFLFCFFLAALILEILVVTNMISSAEIVHDLLDPQLLKSVENRSFQ